MSMVLEVAGMMWVSGGLLEGLVVEFGGEIC